MDQMVIKDEKPSEEILLFYVDEDGTNEQVVLSTVDNIEQIHEQQLHSKTVPISDGTFYLDRDTAHNQTTNDIILMKEKWTDEETKRLLIFYIDNKENFVSGTTKKKHLWTVVCKTMLTGKNPNSCEMKLRYMKKKYYQVRVKQLRGCNLKWIYYDLCHKAFFDDSYVNSLLCDSAHEAKSVTPNNQIVVTAQVQNKSPDDIVERMLQLYIHYKNGGIKENLQKDVWDAIAACLGEEHGEYWHKRFLNYKQHYLRILDKRKECPNTTVNWQYLDLFDQIYQNDVEFQTKYNNNKPTIVALVQNLIDWDYTETTVLVKYYFDCFNEFQDPTIPNNYLWSEVGRLLNKSPDSCHTKYHELKNGHMDRYFQGNYDLRNRVPLSILFDNIISKEVLAEFSKSSKNTKEKWKSEETDKLVQFFYDNIQMFKDSVCHYVCFACIANKLNKPIVICKNHWDDLKILYERILRNKREDSDLQIDWPYIDWFDRIFDYGMDIKMLEGYEKLQKQSEPESETVLAKKININVDDSEIQPLTEDEEYHEKGFIKRSKNGIEDSKAIKILEYYLKNKDKFTSPQTKKLSLWEVLGKQIGMTPSQCAHRFRHFKQVYMSYVERVINKPEIPIVWPYYGICKKIFGYRAIKNKLKLDYYKRMEWSRKEIDQLIEYFANNFANITRCVSDISQWEQLAMVIGKTAANCHNKFIELRKSYRKIRTMKQNNPGVKVSWKYFTIIDNIYKANLEESLNYMQNVNNKDVNNIQDHIQADEDFQCVIVMPEGQDYCELNNAQLPGQNVDLPEITDTEETDTVKLDILELNQENSTIGTAKLTFNSENFGIYTDTLTMEQDILDGNAENSELTTVNFDPNFNDLGLPAGYLGLEDFGFTNENVNATIEQSNKTSKWTKKSKKRLLILYLNYLRRNKGKEIMPHEMWQQISSRFKNKTPLSCRKMFARLRTSHTFSNDDDPNKKNSPYYLLMNKILGTKHKFSKVKKILNESQTFKDVPLPSNKVELALLYYLQHIEEFLSPRIKSKYLWKDLSNNINEPVNIVFNKVNYLKQNYKQNSEDQQCNNQCNEILDSILKKEALFKSIESQNPMKYDGPQHNWIEDEVETLLIWYLTNLEKFKNPKYVRSYLWMEASHLLTKSPLECSKKIAEIRTQYRKMVKENTQELPVWKFYDLCQKIYAKSKRNDQENLMEVGGSLKKNIPAEAT